MATKQELEQRINRLMAAIDAARDKLGEVSALGIRDNNVRVKMGDAIADAIGILETAQQDQTPSEMTLVNRAALAQIVGNLHEAHDAMHEANSWIAEALRGGEWDIPSLLAKYEE